jgi:fatty-acyl-CoA synthase
MRLTAGPNQGLGTWPARRARISPDRTALSDPHRTLTYAELAERTTRLAGALRLLGVGHGDRVAYLGVNAVEVFETLFATWLLGAIAVPLNYRLSGPEIRYMLDDCGASVLVHSADADALVAAAEPCRPRCATSWAPPSSRRARRSTRRRRSRSRTPP